jgi:hypothetical protein
MSVQRSVLEAFFWDWEYRQRAIGWAITSQIEYDAEMKPEKIFP